MAGWTHCFGAHPEMVHYSRNAMLIKLLALWSGTENGKGKETKVAQFLLRGGRGDLNSSH